MQTGEEELIYLSLGSNLGDRRLLLTESLALLSERLGKPRSLSSVIETAPWGFESSHPFLNCVVSFPLSLSPDELLLFTQEVETAMGRTKKSIGQSYCDRPIDIDILFYGNQLVCKSNLVIPHPLLHERLFVLSPLMEIAPELLHPLLGKTVKELYGLLMEKNL